MSLFDKLNGAPQINMQQLQSDPVGMAKQAGYNIPQNLAGNPQAMVQHLIQSGQSHASEDHADDPEAGRNKISRRRQPPTVCRGDGICNIHKHIVMLFPRYVKLQSADRDSGL